MLTSDIWILLIQDTVSLERNKMVMCGEFGEDRGIIDLVINFLAGGTLFWNSKTLCHIKRIRPIKVNSSELHFWCSFEGYLTYTHVTCVIFAPCKPFIIYVGGSVLLGRSKILSKLIFSPQFVIPNAFKKLMLFQNLKNVPLWNGPVWNCFMKLLGHF